MKTRGLAVFFSILALVLLSYTSAQAQEDSTEKSKTEKATEVEKKTITKPTVVVTDMLAEKAKVAEATKAPATTSATFGNHAVQVTEGVTGQAQVPGKWHTVTTWDGSKWVPKRVFYPNKPAEEVKPNN